MNKPVSIRVPHVLSVIQIGDDHGVILPSELLDRLGVHGEEKLEAIEGAEGLTLRRQGTEFDRQMKVMREVMDRRAAALQELAKSDVLGVSRGR
jgi:bifunctional DNA-binding transcriptional regulator/antitoxin component of YhaV-PrlF toxin-antitoxin module